MASPRKRKYQAINRERVPIYPSPSATQFLAHGHLSILVSYGVALRRCSVCNQEVPGSFPLVFTQVASAFFHLAKYLKEPSISYLYWPHWLPISLFSGVHFYKNYVISFLIHEIKGMYFRHSLNKLDFSDFPAFGKLGGKGPAPARQRKNDRRELTSYTLYEKRNSSHWKNRRKTSTTTKSH